MTTEAAHATLLEFAPLPYAYDALKPHIDEQTMHVHRDKHHQTYFNNLKAALEKHPDLLNKPPEVLLRDLHTVPEGIRMAVRNHGGGHVHHAIFWTMMKPEGGGEPTGRIAELMREFGGFEAFKTKFNDMGLKHFGSGWVWLVRTPTGQHEIITTPNQDSPFTQHMFPIMCNDVWEHAYYLKYQNRRGEYLQAWWHVVNWDAINQRIEMAAKF